MESRFNHDFSQVRVHTDTNAAESAREIDARAYTLGQNAVFGEGKYNLSTPEGKRLLTHELVHVVQQTTQPTPFTTAMRVSLPSDSSEQKADEVAHEILTGQPLSQSIQPSAPIIARDPGEGVQTTAKKISVQVVRAKSSNDAAALIWRDDTGAIVGLLEIDTNEHLDQFLAGQVTAEHLVRDGQAMWSSLSISNRDVPRPSPTQPSRTEATEPTAENTEKTKGTKTVEKQTQLGKDSTSDKASTGKGTETAEAAQASSEQSEDSEVVSVAQVVADVATDLTPGVSNVKDAIIALTGVNPITGEKVGILGRIASAIFAIPGIGNALKYIGKGGKLLGKALVWIGKKIGKPLAKLGRWTARQAERAWSKVKRALGEITKPKIPSQRQLPPALPPVPISTPMRTVPPQTISTAPPTPPTTTAPKATPTPKPTPPPQPTKEKAKPSKGTQTPSAPKAVSDDLHRMLSQSDNSSNGLMSTENKKLHWPSKRGGHKVYTTEGGATGGQPQVSETIRQIKQEL